MKTLMAEDIARINSIIAKLAARLHGGEPAVYKRQELLREATSVRHLIEAR